MRMEHGVRDNPLPQSLHHSFIRTAARLHNTSIRVTHQTTKSRFCSFIARITTELETWWRAYLKASLSTWSCSIFSCKLATRSRNLVTRLFIRLFFYRTQSVSWPLYRPTCVSWYPEFCCSIVLLPHAVAGSNCCTWIRKKMLEFSSTVLSAPYVHLVVLQNTFHKYAVSLQCSQSLTYSMLLHSYLATLASQVVS